MEVNLAIISASAVVIAALVAGFFTLLNNYLDRKNEKLKSEISERNAKLEARLRANLQLAEFRQKWIDGLREDMSRFQSFGVTPRLNQDAEQEFYELGTRIELRMNPNDEKFEELHEAMYGFLGAETVLEKYSANPRYVRVCQDILKREWDVLKDEVKEVSSEEDENSMPLKSPASIEQQE